MAKLQCNNVEQCIWLNRLYEHTGAVYLITTNKEMWEYWYIPSIRNIACWFMKRSNSNDILIYNLNQTSTYFRWWIRGIISCPKIRTNYLWLLFRVYFHSYTVRTAASSTPRWLRESTPINIRRTDCSQSRNYSIYPPRIGKVGTNLSRGVNANADALITQWDILTSRNILQGLRY